MARNAGLLSCSSTENSLIDSSSSSSSDSGCARDKGKAPLTAVLCVRPAQGASDDEAPAGSSPRSVQTTFSMAESIGYSTEFVLPLEQQRADHETLSEGMTMSTLLCWTTVVVLAVAAACYIVQSVVA